MDHPTPIPAPTYLPPRAVALGAALEEEAHALVREHALPHGEALLIVAARDAEDVSLELVAHVLPVHLLRYPAVVERAAANWGVMKGLGRRVRKE